MIAKSTMNNNNGVVEVVEEHVPDNHDDDLGEDDDSGSVICNKHPFQSNKSINPGGICAFCLQDKLGKLVSSSFTTTIFPASSSSSPSFRSDHEVLISNGKSITSSNLSNKNTCVVSTYVNKSDNNGVEGGHHRQHSRRARIIPFLFSEKKKKKKESLPSLSTINISSVSSSSYSDPNKNMILKRSKSTATPRRGRFQDVENEHFNSQKRRFWSFLYHTKSTKTTMATAGVMTTNDSPAISQNTNPRDLTSSSIPTKGDCSNDEEAKESPNSQSSAGASSFERKVSRSRSVGCGSRSFSGDFFERISTGLGDCTLRRVESQREGKSKLPSSSVSKVIVSGAVRGEHHHHHHCIKERVKCGGIFGGFIMTSSSSSSTSSSYWVSTTSIPGSGPVVHSRSKSWGWALSSPIRAFSKPSSSNKPNKTTSTKTPNLSAMPSLLSVSS